MIYVDSSFWIALTLPRDQHHEEASALFREYFNNHLVTTNYVGGETWTFLRRKVGHAAAFDFISRLERSPRLRSVRVEEPEEASAWR